MNQGLSSRETLLVSAKALFWTRGYSNVSVREIAREAGVDVALINRYFDSKLGLFKATLETLDPVDPKDFSSPEDFIEAIVDMFVTTPRDGSTVSPVSMILMNASDPEVGDIVIKGHHKKWHVGLTEIFGSPTKAALFFAAVMGFSVADKTLHLKGIAPVGTDEYADQLRYVLRSAVSFADEQ